MKFLPCVKVLPLKEYTWAWSSDTCPKVIRDYNMNRKNLKRTVSVIGNFFWFITNESVIKTTSHKRLNEISEVRSYTDHPRRRLVLIVSEDFYRYEQIFAMGWTQNDEVLSLLIFKTYFRYPGTSSLNVYERVKRVWNVTYKEQWCWKWLAILQFTRTCTKGAGNLPTQELVRLPTANSRQRACLRWRALKSLRYIVRKLSRTLYSKNKPPVLGNAIPVLGVKLKRG